MKRGGVSSGKRSFPEAQRNGGEAQQLAESRSWEESNSHHVNATHSSAQTETAQHQPAAASPAKKP